MKNKYLHLILSIGVLAIASSLQAADENAKVDGNGQFAINGVARLSTQTAVLTGGLDETRRIRTTNDGRLIEYSNVVWRSSMVTSVSSTNTFIVDWDNTADSGTATSTVFSTRNINSNVFDICYPSAPCFYKGFVVGIIETAQRVRIWDNRGSTATASLFDMTFNTSTPVGLTVPFDQWFSSGINVHTDRIGGDVSSDPIFFHRWQPTVLDRHKQGAQAP